MKTTLLLLGTLVGMQFQLIAQTAPVASNVTLLGEALYNSSATTIGTYTTGTLLTGSYYYSDADGDAEATSTYKWYRDGVEIPGETSIRYTVKSADVTKTITFEVTPIDDSPQTGTAVVSSGVAASNTTYDNAGTDNLIYTSGTTHILNAVLGNNKTISVDGASTIVTIHGDLDGSNGVNVSVTNGAQLIVMGQFITNNNVDVLVDVSSTFILESGLVAKNGSDIVISGTMTVNGDFNVENNATISVGTDGLLEVSGDVVFGTNGSLIVDGLMTVDGDMSGTATLSGSGTITVLGTVSNSITDESGVLPIELTYFNAYKTDNGVNLKWVTASELNNDYFTIERSEDGVNFYSIEQVDGAGNSLSELVYSATDTYPLNGINYYRLKQTDFDGAFTYSDIKSVSIQGYTIQSIEEVTIYPNPIASPNFLLSMEIPGDFYNETAIIKVFSFNGQELIEFEILLEGKFNRTAIDISNFKTGNYILLVLTSGNSFKNKLVIL